MSAEAWPRTGTNVVSLDLADEAFLASCMWPGPFLPLPGTDLATPCEAYVITSMHNE